MSFFIFLLVGGQQVDDKKKKVPKVKEVNVLSGKLATLQVLYNKKK